MKILALGAEMVRGATDGQTERERQIEGQKGITKLTAALNEFTILPEDNHIR